MLKRKVTIMLIGLMCFSSVSGFFTVICRGMDGHIAIEPLVHNHCRCSHNGETEKNNDSEDSNIKFSATHTHCTDAVATSNYILPARKTSKHSLYKVFTVKLFLKSNSNAGESIICNLAAQSGQLHSFFTPLETIILLA